METTAKTKKTEKLEKKEKELLTDVNTLMTDLTVDMAFAARWTGYNSTYLSKLLRGVNRLTENVRSTLEKFRDKLLRMKQIMLLEAA